VGTFYRQACSFLTIVSNFILEKHIYTTDLSRKELLTQKEAYAYFGRKKDWFNKHHEENGGSMKKNICYFKNDNLVMYRRRALEEWFVTYES
jgi:hypothetical protein